MATNPSKGQKRQPQQESVQDLANQSYDPTFATFVGQVGGSPDGTNFYLMKVKSDGSLPVVNPDGSTIGGSSTGLTDAQLRATPVPVSLSTTNVTVNASEIVMGSVNVVDTTDTEINPAKEDGNLATLTAKDFATQTTLAAIKAKTDNLDVLLSTRTKPADAQHVIVDSGVTTGLTDTQLRASAVPISLATAPTTPVTNAGLTNLDVALSTRTKPSDQQHVIIDTIPTTAVTGPLTDTQLRASAVPVTANAGTNLNTSALALESGGNLAAIKSNTTPLLPLSVTGNITSNQTVNLSTVGAQTVSINVSGTWTGTLQPQFSIDGTNYSNVGVIPFGSPSASVPTITSNGNYWVVISGTKNFQILGNAVGSGTAVVVINTAPQGFGQLAVQSVAANLKAQVSFDPTTSLPAGTANIGTVQNIDGQGSGRTAYVTPDNSMQTSDNSTRRIMESLLLEQQIAGLRQMMSYDTYGGSRYGIELR